MTTATDLATLTGDAYSSGDRSNAITLAEKALGLTSADDDQSDFAIVRLAQKLLQQLRMEERARTNPQLLIEVAKLNVIIDDEIERYKNQPVAGTVYDVIQFKQPDTSKHWSKGED